MTTARDVIANKLYDLELGLTKVTCLDVADEQMKALLSAPEPVRLELAGLLIPPRERTRLAFPNAMTIAEHGFDAWATKSHNAKWVKLIDGTPIKNDLLVNIALAMCEPPHLPTPPLEEKTP